MSAKRCFELGKKIMNKENQESRMVQELSNRKAALNKKHEMEQNALKSRQDRESEALEIRFSQRTAVAKKGDLIH